MVLLICSTVERVHGAPLEWDSIQLCPNVILSKLNPFRRDGWSRRRRRREAAIEIAWSARGSLPFSRVSRGNYTKEGVFPVETSVATRKCLSLSYGQPRFSPPRESRFWISVVVETASGRVNGRYSGNN